MGVAGGRRVPCRRPLAAKRGGGGVTDLGEADRSPGREGVENPIPSRIALREEDNERRSLRPGAGLSRNGTYAPDPGSRATCRALHRGRQDLRAG